MFSDTLLHPPPAPPADRLDAAIRDVMRPGVIVISGHASVARAQRALLAHGVHAILVLDDAGGRPVGWVTSRGLLRWADRDIALCSARDAVTEAPVAIDPSATAHEALALLERAPGDFAGVGLAARIKLQQAGTPDLGDAFAALDAGDLERALDLLLAALPSADGAKDEIRKVVVGILDELGVEHPLARDARRRLAAALY